MGSKLRQYALFTELTQDEMLKHERVLCSGRKNTENNAQKLSCDFMCAVFQFYSPGLHCFWFWTESEFSDESAALSSFCTKHKQSQQLAGEQSSIFKS